MAVQPTPQVAPKPSMSKPSMMQNKPKVSTTLMNTTPMTVPQKPTVMSNATPNPVPQTNVANPSTTIPTQSGGKRWWFWALIGLFIILVLSAVGIGIWLWLR